MTLPRPTTIRARLTLLTTLVMGIVLFALGFLVDYGTGKTLMGAVEGDLSRRGHDFAQSRGRDEGPRPPRDDAMGGIFGLLGGGSPGRRPFGGPRGGQDQTRPRFIQIDDESGHPMDHPEPPYDSAALIGARTKPYVFSTVEINGEPTRVYSEAVRTQGRLRGVVQVARPLGDVVDSLASLRRLLLTIVVPLGALLAGLASLFVVGRMLRPLRIITENAEHIGGNNLADRLTVVGQDEFAGLAKTLNGMLTRLEVAFRLEQATTRRLEETVIQQRRFTADASHELKTPLSTIKAHTGLLRMSELAEEDRESAVAIDVAASRMRTLVDDLLTLARADGGSLTARTEPVDMAETVSAAVGAVSPLSVEIRNASRPLVVQGNGEALTRLFINLLDNAKKYADGPVEVRLAKRGSSAEIAVVDRGVGIAAEHLPKLFDRFYRPDTSRTSDTGGTGLGLAICREIAEAHGGTIEVASAVGQGTAFTVALPLAGG